MAQDKRSDAPGLAQPTRGNQQKAGTSAHETHARDQAEAAKDNTAEGVAGREKGEARRDR